MQGLREAIGQMPYRRRYMGMSALERHEEASVWMLIAGLVQVQAMLPPGPVSNAVAFAAALFTLYATSLRIATFTVLGAVNPANRNRDINTFSDDFCWHVLRFRKRDLHRLYPLMQFPAQLHCDNGTTCCGEYAFCLMIFRLAYPTRLVTLQEEFGREYSQLSRIFQEAIDITDVNHRHRVVDCLDWYVNRLDMYNDAIQRLIAGSPHNTQPGMLPANLVPLCGFLDGTYQEISRLEGQRNLQNSFWNGYKKKHCVLYQGISFPDGMTSISGPEPGYFTDIMGWRDSPSRPDFAAINVARVAAGLLPLKLYTDKGYNNTAELCAAWSRRHGNVVQPWMREQNRIMSGLRSGVEWSFGTIFMLCKYVSFALGQKLNENRTLAKYFYAATLIANCRTCIYGASPHLSFFNVLPPPLNVYML